MEVRVWYEGAWMVGRWMMGRRERAWEQGRLGLEVVTVSPSRADLESIRAVGCCCGRTLEVSYVSLDWHEATAAV